MSELLNLLSNKLMLENKHDNNIRWGRDDLSVLFLYYSRVL
jgi:hypothetical protein